MGSNAHGSEGALSRLGMGKTEALGHEGWRDWANLLPDLVEKVAGQLLSVDVAEYLRFRAVCRPWRELTADPRAGGPLDSRFRPRNWMVLSMAPDAGPRRRFLNLATAASIGVDLPTLSTHCLLCYADGLQVLFHKATNAICLLDPLSKVVTEFPAISCTVDAEPPSRYEDLPALFENPEQAVSGAGFDDSTSPPTLVLLLRKARFSIIFAKPGDAHWMHWKPSSVGRHLSHSLLSVGGRCYVASAEGSVFLMELQPLPWLVEMLDQRGFFEPDHFMRHKKTGISFLVGDGGERILMVRCWRYAGCDLPHVEVSKVDISGSSLVPVSSLGHHALFVGLTHCVLISTKLFPSIAADAVYVGFSGPRNQSFSIYGLNDGRRRNQPLHKFGVVGPWNIDEHIVCYVERLHNFCIPCSINQARN